MQVHAQRQQSTFIWQRLMNRSVNRCRRNKCSDFSNPNSSSSMDVTYFQSLQLFPQVNKRTWSLTDGHQICL